MLRSLAKEERSNKTRAQRDLGWISRAADLAEMGANRFSGTIKFWRDKFERQ